MGAEAATSGVPNAALLLEFVEAVLAADERRLNAARQTLHDTLGAAALIDAAAIVASFNAVVKLADASGIPLEDAKAEATAELRRTLDIDRFEG